MGMVQQLLIPGVEHGQEAEVRSESARVGGDGQQRLRNSAEEDAVNQALILQRQGGKLLRQGENGVAIGYRQEFRRPSSQPLVTGSGLALWAVAIPAGVVGNGLVGAVVALLEVGAESGGAAGADVSEGSALRGIERLPPLPEEFLFVLAKDIGDFEPMFAHRCRPSS